jgi:hypothetical protein
MEKLLLLSALVMMVVAPLRAARVRDPKRALRRALTHFFTFNVFYFIAVIVIWFTLLHGDDPASLLHVGPEP